MYISVDSDVVFKKQVKPNYERGQDREFHSLGPVTIIPRQEWEARPPKDKLPPMPGGVAKHVLYVYQTHTDPCYSVSECTTQLLDLQKRCFDKDKPDIFYNFMIGGDGKAYECRGWNTMPDVYQRLGDHMDPATLYIGYIGDFVDIRPSVKQWYAGWKLLEFGFRNQLISEKDFRLFYCS